MAYEIDMFSNRVMNILSLLFNGVLDEEDNKLR